MRNIARNFLLSGLLAVAACGSAIGAEGDWLIGKWEMAQDPDGNAKDWMEFAAGGKVASIYPDGRRVPGTYSTSVQAVDIVFSAPNGRSIPIQLTYGADRSELRARSEQTGHTSIYKKVQ